MQPIFLRPALKDYVWGGNTLRTAFGKTSDAARIAESWELSVHPDGPSTAVGGAFDGQTLGAILRARPAFIGGGRTELPVLVKLIDAEKDLSVQVHPNDAYARAHEGDNGKTEMWYVVAAEPGAGIYCGFEHDVTAEEFDRALADNTVASLLHFIPVKAGDSYLIEAGTVHAICAGVTVCEVQQSSNVTYRVYDYGRLGADGRPRPLHVEKAKAVLDRSAFRDRTGSGSPVPTAFGTRRLLTECAQFRAEEWSAERPFDLCNGGSFTALTVIEGAATLAGGGHTVSLGKGDSAFVPCGCACRIEGAFRAIATTLPTLAVGVDLGGTFVKAGVCTSSGRILAKGSVPTGADRPYGAIAADMAALVRGVCAKAGVATEAVRAVGVGSPGTIDSAQGVIVYANNIRWENVPLGAELSRLTGLPVAVTNDANAAALGEAMFGAGKAYDSSVLITLGTGVGGGIVLDGKLFEGYRSAGAEIGHTVIVRGGEPCTCGRKGCFEAYASATALVRETRRAMEAHPESKMWQVAGSLEAADGATPFTAASLGDPAARAVVDAYLDALAEGIANIVNILRPRAIMLGGGVSAQGKNLTEPLQKLVDARIYGGPSIAPCEIVTATLGNDAGLLGAAAFALSRCGEKQ